MAMIIFITSNTELNMLTGLSWVMRMMVTKMMIMTSKTELNMLIRTSRVVMRSPLRLAMSSLGRRKLDQETATKNPEQNLVSVVSR